ncbi:transposase [bacterium]|nr:transposase [bacterium]
MTSDNEHFNSLIGLLLPPGIFKYFDIKKVQIDDAEVHVHLDEKPIKPDGYEIVNRISKGFHLPSIIQDFPLRDKAMNLQVRRRRWYSESTGKTVERDWDTVAKGTRLTKDFATFLKGIFG